jgi:hypothetical protein
MDDATQIVKILERMWPRNKAEGINATLSNESTACYIDRKSKFRIFCRSVQLLLDHGDKR